MRAFNHVIDKGKVQSHSAQPDRYSCLRQQAYYWGTSEWSVHEIEEAHRSFRVPLQRAQGDLTRRRRSGTAQPHGSRR